MKKVYFAVASFLVASLASIVTSAPASAEQCIYNQSGYVARIKWYKPSDIQVKSDTNGNITAELKNRQVTPVAEKRILLKQESCTGKSEQLLAVVSVEGGKYAKTAAQVSIKGLVTAGAVVVCAGSTGLGCAVGAKVAPIVAAGAANAIPDAKEIFYIDIPQAFEKRRLKQDLRLILFGTVFDPKVRFGAILK